MHALYCIDAMGGEAMALIKADLQNKLISLVQDLLASAFSVKTVCLLLMQFFTFRSVFLYLQNL